MRPKIKLTYGTLQTQLIVTPLTAITVVITRSAGVAYFALGTLACALFAKGLKKVLRQPRPVLVPDQNKKRGQPKKVKLTYGYVPRLQIRTSLLSRPSVTEPRLALQRMPSTHSSAMIFMATYITLAAMRLPLHRSLASLAANQPSYEVTLRTIAPPVGAVWAGLVAVSRIWLGHHTKEQVLAGCLVGFLFAWAWFQSYVLGMNVIGERLEAYIEAVLQSALGIRPLS